MQMRQWLYEPKSKKSRAAYHRAAARELELKGFPGMAEASWQMAEWLDPTPKERPTRAPRREGQTVDRSNGPVGTQKAPQVRAPRFSASRARLPVSGARPAPRITAVTRG